MAACVPASISIAPRVLDAFSAASRAQPAGSRSPAFQDVSSAYPEASSEAAMARTLASVIPWLTAWPVLEATAGRLLGGRDLLAVGRAVGAAGSSGHLRAYAADPALERLLARHRLDGGPPATVP